MTNDDKASVERVVIGSATLYLGDCFDVLPALKDVDCVITDPPFGIGNFVQVTGRISGRGENKGVAVDWNDETPDKRLWSILRQMSRHRIIWGANFFNCFEPNGGAIVWDKKQGMPNFSKVEIASCSHNKKTEIIHYPWRNFEASREKMTDHPCERPPHIYEWCIKYLPKCRNVLDPFMGSGSCGVAAAKSGVPFIGIERDPKYFKWACDRISAAQSQMSLAL